MLAKTGVGDRVHLSDPQNETSPEGSSCWIVEKVGLTTTTVFWGTTNERATLSNGAIANLRVINAARSPNATVFVVLKFGIDTPYEKIAIFRSAVEQFLKDRPREWLTFIGFRPTEVVVDQAYIGKFCCSRCYCCILLYHEVAVEPSISFSVSRLPQYCRIQNYRAT